MQEMIQGLGQLMLTLTVLRLLQMLTLTALLWLLMAERQLMLEPLLKPMREKLTRMRQQRALRAALHQMEETRLVQLAEMPSQLPTIHPQPTRSSTV